MNTLLSRPKKKPLIGQTHADRSNVDKIDKPNAEIVALSQQPCSCKDDAGASVQQRTVEQVIEVPDDNEERAQKRTVEQIVNASVETVPSETAPAEIETATFDRESLGVTQHVERPPPRQSAVRVFAQTLHTSRVRTCPPPRAGQTALQARQRGSAEREREAFQCKCFFAEAASAGAFPPGPTHRLVLWTNTLLLLTPKTQQPHQSTSM